MYYGTLSALETYPMNFGISQDIFFRKLESDSPDGIMTFLSTPIQSPISTNLFANYQVDCLNVFLQDIKKAAHQNISANELNQVWSVKATEHFGLPSQFYGTQEGLNDIILVLTRLVQSIQPIPTQLSELSAYIKEVKSNVCKPFVDTLFPVLSFPQQQSIFSDFSKLLNKAILISLQDVFEHVNFTQFINKNLSASDALENPKQVVAMGDPGTIFTYPLSKKYDIERLNSYCKSGNFYSISDNLQNVGDVSHFMCL
jgi:hypothetical protein